MAHTPSQSRFADGPEDDAQPVIMPPHRCCRQAGFAPEEALLPFPARSFSGFRLLTEYFAAPEKFHVHRRAAAGQPRPCCAAGNQLDIFIYLDRALPELERTVDTGSFALGCTPIVNLFPQRCEPMPARQHSAIEFRVVPGCPASGNRRLEIWSVERVRETLAGGDGLVAWQPFHRGSPRTPGRWTVDQHEEPGGYYWRGAYGAATACGGHGARNGGVPRCPMIERLRSRGLPARDSVLSVDALCLQPGPACRRCHSAGDIRC